MKKKNPLFQSTTDDLFAQKCPHHHQQQQLSMSKSILVLVATVTCAYLVGTAWLMRRWFKTKTPGKKRSTSSRIYKDDIIAPPVSRPKEHASFSGTATSYNKTMIPFVVYGPNYDNANDKNNLILYKNLQNWKEHNHGLLLQLSRAMHTVQQYSYESWDASSLHNHHHRDHHHHQAPSADYSFLLDTWEKNLEDLAHALEEETELLQHYILKPFETVRAISEQPHSSVVKKDAAATADDDDDDHNVGTTATTTSTTASHTAPPNIIHDDHSYNEVGQVVAHLVRDWTTEGRTIRANLYDWCCQRVTHYRSGTTSSTRSSSSSSSHQYRIVVPGAGVGRLAWDLFMNHQNQENNTSKHSSSVVAVEAVESSWSMAAAAAAILQRHATGQLRPYAADHWTNQVHSRQRYDVVSFPDTNVANISSSSSSSSRRNSHGSSLSYTIADFVQLRSIPGYKSHVDVVVTCFFIDTAVNILDYVDTIRTLLKKDGLWVNVGPLQWHRQSRLPVSADELKQIVLVAGFDILEWGVDITPVEYRNSQWSDPRDHQASGDGTTIRSTHYDAYCPLRFVVRLTKA